MANFWDNQDYIKTQTILDNPWYGEPTYVLTSVKTVEQGREVEVIKLDIKAKAIKPYASDLAVTRPLTADVLAFNDQGLNTALSSYFKVEYSKLPAEDKLETKITDLDAESKNLLIDNGLGSIKRVKSLGLASVFDIVKAKKDELTAGKIVEKLEPLFAEDKGSHSNGDLKDEVTKAQKTANEAKSSADKASSQASANKTAIDNLTGQVNTVKGTADGAKSTADTAKSTADSANTQAQTNKNDIAGVKTNVTNLTSRVTKNEADIKKLQPKS